MNLRYAPFDWWTVRGSIGLGYRSPNAIADNAAYLASNRMYYAYDRVSDNGYGIMDGILAQERSMNTGLSTVFYIPLGKRELQLSGEYYYTKFLDGVIADMDRNLHGITLYNMHDVEGAQYFSHNWQLEANVEILRGWTMTAAFRYTDVQLLFLSTNNNNVALVATSIFRNIKESRKTKYAYYLVADIHNFVIINMAYFVNINTLTFDNVCNWNRVNFCTNANKQTLNNCKSKRNLDNK